MVGQGQSASPEEARALESLLGFWRDAGVEASYAEAPVDRLAAPPPRTRPKAAAPAEQAAAPMPAAPGLPDFAAAVAQAKAMADGAADLVQLEAAIGAFEGCGLRYEGARRAVFARGNPEGPVMAIGEGPGGEEDMQGLPFVGRAGKLLDRMLDAAGLTDRVFITNTVYWRPPGNRTPTPAEQASCRPFLERAIALVQPRYLLLVGAASAKSLLRREEGILSLRGRWFEWTAEDGSLALPALPTLHPAFLLRQPAAKKKAWADLLTLVERLDRPERPTGS